MAKLFKRGNVWHCKVRLRRGKWVPKSTHCTDRRAAEIVAADLERSLTDPTYRAARAATTQRVLDEYFKSRQRLGRAEGSLHHVRVKCGNLLALLPSHAEDITHAGVERYIDARLAENVRRTTIKKELRVLKAALRHARKNKLFFGDPSDVIPELPDDHEPRKRVLRPWELVGASAVLKPHRLAVVAFIVATGCDYSALSRAKPADVAPDFSAVQIHGTKRKSRERTVPVVLPGQRQLLQWALANADGGPHGLLFSPWSNMRRDLHEAAKKMGVPGFSANDLRRTYGTWLREAGVEPQLIAPAMGHADSRMVERVYGRLTPEALGKLLDERVREPEPDPPTPPAGPSAASQGTAPLVRHGGAGDGSAGCNGTPLDDAIPCEKGHLLGAQGRNRTADTGIFSRPFDVDETLELPEREVGREGGGAPLVRHDKAGDSFTTTAHVPAWLLAHAAIHGPGRAVERALVAGGAS